MVSYEKSLPPPSSSDGPPPSSEGGKVSNCEQSFLDMFYNYISIFYVCTNSLPPSEEGDRMTRANTC